MLNSAAGVTFPPTPTLPPAMTTWLIIVQRSGSRFKARAKFVSGPKQRIVTSSSAVRTSSQIILSEGCWRCNSDIRNPAFPKPSEPCSNELSAAGALSISVATPIRGNRGGSSCSVIVCTLRLAWCASPDCTDGARRAVDALYELHTHADDCPVDDRTALAVRMRSEE